jgi:hypothetical protein
MEKRIREQLERSERLQACCAIRVSSTGVWLPSPVDAQPLQKLVEQVADSITEITLSTLRRHHPSPNDHGAVG